jgi:prolipoprotein diacylglyceryl transferase
MMLGTIVGARLGHCFFYRADYFLANPIEILMIWKGGLASHGATLGILTALYLYSRSRPDQSYVWLLDRMSIVVALGGSFIRLGNFFNSEIVGKPTSVAWAVIFDRVDQVARHPTQLYESLAYLTIFIVLLLIYRRYRSETPGGMLFGTFLVMVFGFRFGIEFFKESHAPFEASMMLNMGQTLSIPLIIVGIVIVSVLLLGKRREVTRGKS